MIASFESLLPVFLVIALGFALRRGNVIPEDMWRGVELVGYWVFFPALLTDTLARSDLANLPLGAISATMLGAFGTLAVLLLGGRRRIIRILGISGPAYSSLYQGAVRWNGFIALPILAKLYGNEGVALVAVIIGILVPLSNILAVYVLTRNADGVMTLRQTAYIAFRNPFIWSTLLGAVINLAGIPVYAPLMTTLNMLGTAAIGSGLLTIGAGLSTRETLRPSLTAWVSSALKLLGMPLLVLLWSLVTGVSGTAFVACIICAAVPTAMSAYVMAKQMGGDAPLMAVIVTLQTVLSFVTIALLIRVAQALQ